MKLKVVSIVICMLGTVPNNLERRQEEFDIRGRIKVIQIIELLRSTRTPPRILGSFFPSDSSEMLLVKTGRKNSQEEKLFYLPKMKKNKKLLYKL